MRRLVRATRLEWADRRALRREIVAAESRYAHLYGPFFWAKWSIGTLASAGAMYLCIVGVDGGGDGPNHGDRATCDKESSGPASGPSQHTLRSNADEYSGAEVEGARGKPLSNLGESGPFVGEGRSDLREAGNNGNAGDDNRADRSNNFHPQSPVALSHNRMTELSVAGNGGGQRGRVA